MVVAPARLLQLDPELAVDLANRRVAADDRRAVRLARQRRNALVVLAEDVAHQLLDQILERHHARHDAVLVHGDRDALALALHEAQHLDRRDRLREKLHAAQQVLQARPARRPTPATRCPSR